MKMDIDLSTVPEVIFAHKDDPNGQRYRQFATDKLPPWAVRVIYDDGQVKSIILWSLRHTIARGWHWKNERTCQLATAAEWLELFRKDEPEVKFTLSSKRPKLPLECVVY